MTDAEAAYNRHLSLQPKSADGYQLLATLYRNEADRNFARLAPVTEAVVRNAPFGPAFAEDAISSSVHDNAVNTAAEIYRSFREAKNEDSRPTSAPRRLFRGPSASCSCRAPRSRATAPCGRRSTSRSTSRRAPSPRPRRPTAPPGADAYNAFVELLTYHKKDDLTAQIKQRMQELQQFVLAPASS